MRQYKLMVICALLVVIYSRAITCKAQTWDEFFRQKETQREYLILQIGALKTQSNLLAESASIFRYGLDAIGNWKDLEKEIHTVFFDSFKKMGPISRTEYDRSIGAEISPEVLLARIESSNRYWQGKVHDPDYQSMNNAIHEGLRKRCLDTMAKLKLILGNELELSDGDRAKRIAQIAEELKVIQSDLLRLHVWSGHRVQMNQQKGKWQKDLNTF